MEKKVDNKVDNKKENRLDEKNVKRLVIFGVVAVVLFFIVPKVLEFLPDETEALCALFFGMVVNQVFVGVVGWQANYFPKKIGIYMPTAVVLLYLLSSLVLYGRANFTLEINYLETAYIAFFLKRLLMRRQVQEQKQAQKPFPKSVTRKK